MCDDRAHRHLVAALVAFDSIKTILVAKALATCSVKCLVEEAVDVIRLVHNVVAILKQHCRSVLLKR